MTSPASLAASATHAAELLASDPRAALSGADAMLKHAPNDPRALLIRASALRRMGDFAAAHAVLVPLAHAYPKAARTQYELGLVALALDQDDAGVAALRRAVALAPALTQAWQALGDYFFRIGDTAAADLAFAALELGTITDAALRPAAAALFAGDLTRAETLLHARIAASPDHFDALRLMAELRLRQEQFAAAETLFEHCLALDPTHDGVRFSYALALYKRQAGGPALDQIAALIGQDPQNVAYRNLHATTLALIGRYGEALAIYEVLLAEFPRHPQIWLNYGHALRTLRRRDHAVAAYCQAIAIAPQLGEAYWSLANLKTVALTDEQVLAMAAQLARGDIASKDRIHFHYALGKSFEDRGDFAASFGEYAAGAAIRHADLAHDLAAAADATARIIATFDAPLFARFHGMGCPASSPIFVVGLPRSGSTLVEQILASHSQVEGTMELPDMAVIAEASRAAAATTAGSNPPRGFPETVLDLDGSKLAEMGEAYLRRTAIHRPAGKAYFIDKMPNNFMFTGLIHLVLPNARIIDVRRHPTAACFSGFKQLFATGHHHSYDLGALGHYYRDYVELMRHFDAVLPGRVHRLIYEDLIADTEGEVRRLLAHCRLPFEYECLRFYENERAVRTVSSEQVRRPIFRDGLEQWRNFAPWLGPLQRALGPALTDWRA